MSHFPTFYRSIESILLTLWIGSMWFVGYVAAPVLFSALESRQLAGMVAGHLFAAEHYLGLVCGGLLLPGAILCGWRVQTRNYRLWVLLLMLLLICVGQFVLQPLMAEAKAAGLEPGSASAARFGMLHGISASLYLVTSLLGLLLVWWQVGRGAARG